MAAHRLGRMAGRIRDSDIAEVRDRTRIEEVVGEYVALRRAGAGSLKGLCPFHDEKTPSFTVRPSHGSFHCFGCAEGGDVIEFVMQIEHIGFVEAVERLADRIGYRLTYSGGGSSVQRDRGTRSRLLEANKKAAEFYAAALRTPEAAPAVEFLTARGFDGAAAQTFGCGYAPAGWDALTKHLLAAGFSLDELMKAGLSKEGRRGPIDRFHRRLLWPIRDLGGDVVGFGARRIFDDDPIEAKYLNTPETPVYRKTHVLFGLDLAKREIAKRRQVVVVEGYTDVMAMHLAGVPHRRRLLRHGVRRRARQRDPPADGRRLVRPRRGHLHLRRRRRGAGGRAARRSTATRAFAAQTFVCVAPDGQDPCDLRLSAGRHRGARPRGPPRAAVRVRHPHRCCASTTWTRAEGRVARAAARACRIVARIKREELRDEYARRLAGWTGWDDIAMVVRRVRETRGGAAPSGRATPAPPWPHRPATTRACTASARRSRRRCRCRRSPGRATTSCPSRRSRTRRTCRCTGRSRWRAGCAAVARARRGWTP